ncbi:MAG: amino acid ABC transporter ATP-binding protein [Thermoplasmatales archaeon]|nr:MAG: amino acid ABC transporter ATP-binding protein [Thermoplasmatales archaeon]
MLEVKDIHKSFGQLEVLKGISFNMDKGKTKVIIGTSGTGKSTLLRCINQLDPPDKGEVFLEGEEISHLSKNINRIRQKIGFVFQDFNLFNHLTAIRNISIGLEKVRGIKKEDAKKRALKELGRVGLVEQANQYPAQLSGGQKQRVGIARALAMDPVIILFDEPTSALDPELIGEVLEVMKGLAGKVSMLVVTHEMGFARNVADEIIFMENGIIVESGPPKQMFRNPKKARTKEFLGKIATLYGEE